MLGTHCSHELVHCRRSSAPGRTQLFCLIARLRCLSSLGQITFLMLVQLAHNGLMQHVSKRASRLVTQASTTKTLALLSAVDLHSARQLWPC
jgi:hypothetical protein